MSTIEDFALNVMGIRLTLIQMKMLRAWSVGAEIIVPKRAGITTARRVYYAYLQQAVKERQ